MTFQGVPWAIGGGAENPPEAGRLLAHVATRGMGGVLTPADCVPSPMVVPSGNVRIGPGALVIPNTKAGAFAEAYLGRNPEDHVVAIAPTGAGAGRSDLVYVRVADPQYAGEPVPADVAHGPYIVPAVASGVTAGTTTVAQAIAQGILPVGTVGEAICRVDLAANTGTVTAAAVIDVRRMPAPRSQRRTLNAMPAGNTVSNSATWVIMPSVATWQVDVPEWATHAIVDGRVLAVQYGTSQYVGAVRFSLGTAVGQNVGLDMQAAANTEKTTIEAVDTVAIPTAMRGTTVTLKLEVSRASGTGTLTSTSASAAIADIEFQERIK